MLKKKKKTRTLKQTNQLLQKLYYEVDRPSALGGVDKLYCAFVGMVSNARKYSIGSVNNRAIP